MSTIAFLGLGQMGSPMASNLLRKGHSLRVFDLNQQAVNALVEKERLRQRPPQMPPWMPSLSSPCCLMATLSVTSCSAKRACAKR
jgi:6-phosphogluconate dehydrogenase (decarboxylating)